MAPRRSAAESPPPFQLTEIGPGVFAAIDGPAHASGSNAGFVIGDGGVLVVDSFLHPAAASALLAEIRKRTDKPVLYVVNTHYHGDHVAGDGVFKAQGAVILAHRNVRAWIRTENLHLFGPNLSAEDRAAIAALTLPDIGLEGRAVVWLGARRVEIAAEPGHTGGDLIVSVPDADVVFCGDLLWRRIPPNMIDGTTSDWIRSLAALAARGDAKTRFVPGHGDLADVGDVRDAEAYMAALEAAVRTASAAGLSGAALVTKVQEALAPRYGAWTAFAGMSSREIPLMEAELAGAKRRPVPSPN